MRHPWPPLWILANILIWLIMALPVRAETTSPAPAQTPAANSVEPIPMRLAAIHKGDVTYVQALTRLTKTVEESSGKRIRPELLANGKKGPEETALQELLQGNLEGGFFSVLTLSRSLPAFRVLATPMLFNRPEQVRAFVGSPLDQGLREMAKTKRLLVLGYGSYGFYGIMNFRPAKNTTGTTPSLKQLATRVPNDPWMLEVHQAMGLRPATLPASDLADAIAGGWIQGLSATPEMLNRTSFANANAGAFHQTRHLHGWMVLVLHGEWFNKLPADLQEVITKAAATVLPQTLEQALAQEQKILNKWTSDQHFTILTPSLAEITTSEVKSLALKHAREMEGLFNQPGLVVQSWEQNQIAAAAPGAPPPGKTETKKTPAPPAGQPRASAPTNTNTAPRDPTKSRTTP
ncbi:MAG: TRAP transporter substrate-binding protein DctP [Magnetococcales bacterium]|nr:TRAP transporter substrate-binding protein DctP [Magnetococcales bacterium]